MSNTTLFDEDAADAEVRRVLTRHRKIMLIVNEEIAMFYKNNDGAVLEVVEFKEASRDALVANIKSLETALATAVETLAAYDEVAGTTTVEEPAPQPDHQPEPVVEIEKPVEVPEAAPEQPVEPVSPTVQDDGAVPESPVTDTPPEPPTIVLQ